MVFRQVVHFCRIPYSLRLRIVEYKKMLINPIVSKQLSRLNERLISSYRTLSNLLKSHAIVWYVCALPCSTLYEWNLIATIAS